MGFHDRELENDSMPQLSHIGIIHNNGLIVLDSMRRRIRPVDTNEQSKDWSALVMRQCPSESWLWNQPRVRKLIVKS